MTTKFIMTDDVEVRWPAFQRLGKRLNNHSHMIFLFILWNGINSILLLILLWYS